MALLVAKHDQDGALVEPIDRRGSERSASSEGEQASKLTQLPAPVGGAVGPPARTVETEPAFDGEPVGGGVDLGSEAGIGFQGLKLPWPGSRPWRTTDRASQAWGDDRRRPQSFGCPCPLSSARQGDSRDSTGAPSEPGRVSDEPSAVVLMVAVGGRRRTVSPGVQRYHKEQAKAPP